MREETKVRFLMSVQEVFIIMKNKNKSVPEHFPIPHYWNWQWYKKFKKKKENIVTIFKNFFKS